MKANHNWNRISKTIKLFNFCTNFVFVHECIKSVSSVSRLFQDIFKCSRVFEKSFNQKDLDGRESFIECFTNDFNLKKLQKEMFNWNYSWIVLFSNFIILPGNLSIIS